MVKSREKVVEAYRDGVTRIGGAAKYYECGSKADVGPAIEVAKCLEAAKKAKTTEDFVAAYAKAMFGG